MVKTLIRRCTAFMARWGLPVACCLLLVAPLVRAEEPPASASSQATPALKIGFVNLAKLFDNYERTKASDAVLEKKSKQKEVELEGRMTELKKLRENLELLNDAARDTKAREAEEKADELQRFRSSTARDLRRDRDKAAKEILADIEQALDEYAKSHGFSMLLDSRSLLYGKGAYDVTDEVLAYLNSQRSNAPR